MSNEARNIDYDAEIAKIDAEIANLEREKLGLPEPLSWDELQKAGAVKKVQEADARRGLIPRFQRAGRVRRLELVIAREEKLIRDMEARQEELFAELETKRQQIQELQPRVDVLGSEHTQSVHRIQERRRRISAAQREINNIRGGVDG